MTDTWSKINNLQKLIDIHDKKTVLLKKNMTHLKKIQELEKERNRCTNQAEDIYNKLKKFEMDRQRNINKCDACINHKPCVCYNCEAKKLCYGCLHSGIPSDHCCKGSCECLD